MTSFSAASKPILGSDDVVEHDGVEALAVQLLARVRERALAVLGGEADQALAGAAARRRARESTSSVRSSSSASSAPVLVLLELAGVRVLGGR